MNSKSEALFSEQLAEINKRLGVIESRLDGMLDPAKTRQSAPGSFQARRQEALNAFHKKMEEITELTPLRISQIKQMARDRISKKHPKQEK